MLPSQTANPASSLSTQSNNNSFFMKDDEFLKSHNLSENVSEIDKPHSMGTSIMAVEFDGGVILGADSRTSTGVYVANRVSKKITPVHDRIYVCRSGNAAHTQALGDYIRFYMQMHSVEYGEYPLVKTASELFRLFNYGNKDLLLAGLICAGWDPQEGGSVYSIPIGGSLVRQPFAIGGSGSTFIYGYCDSNFKHGMSKDECKEFVKNAISLAMARDGSSGGVIRLTVIDKDGVHHETHQEGAQGTIPKNFYQD